MVVQLPRPHSPSSFFRLRSSPVSAGFVSQNAQLGKGPDPSSFFRPHSGLVCTAGAERFRFVRERRWFSGQARIRPVRFSEYAVRLHRRVSFGKKPSSASSGFEFVFSTAFRHCLHLRSGAARVPPPTASRSRYWKEDWPTRRPQIAGYAGVLRNGNYPSWEGVTLLVCRRQEDNRDGGHL